MPKLARIRLQVAIVIRERDGVFIARCPFLNVTTHADAPARALENLRAEVEFLFATAGQDGSLLDVLEFRTTQGRATAAPVESGAVEVCTLEFDLPADIPDHLLKRVADAPELSA
jgi:predicted RNase H-like HicB family nuclease